MEFHRAVLDWPSSPFFLLLVFYLVSMFPAFHPKESQRLLLIRPWFIFLVHSSFQVPFVIFSVHPNFAFILFASHLLLSSFFCLSCAYKFFPHKRMDYTFRHNQAPYSSRWDSCNHASNIVSFHIETLMSSGYYQGKGQNNKSVGPQGMVLCYRWKYKEQSLPVWLFINCVEFCAVAMLLCFLSLFLVCS